MRARPCVELSPSLFSDTVYQRIEQHISPILTYNSEAWGVFTKSDFKSWDTSPIEKSHLQFCKRYLQVNNKASNITCWAELGRFPLIFDINKRILKYRSYLQKLPRRAINRNVNRSLL